jgi:ATP-dependent DNA helicase RecQ
MLEGFAEEYAARMGGDRVRLEAMVRYAETTECRIRYIRQYFGEEPGEDCEHCDNCRDHPAERLVAKTSEPVVTEPFKVDVSEPEAPFNVGEKVVHPSFGQGEVRQIEGENVIVSFAVAGKKRPMTKTVRASYLAAAS